MLHRIGVGIGDMLGKVVRVRDDVFPEPALPYAAFAGAAARCQVRITGQAARETGLDPAPPAGKVAVALGVMTDRAAPTPQP